MNPLSRKTLAADALNELMDEELESMTETDVDVALQELGIDPQQALARMEAIFQATLKKQASQRLAEAKQARAAELAKLQAGASSLASATHAELTAMVAARFQSMKPQQGTLMHRDFKRQTEEDLRTLLRQLDALQDSTGKGDVS
jgi:hypothetical protein